MRILVLLLSLLSTTGSAQADFQGLLDLARTRATPELLAQLAAGEPPNPPSWHHGYSPLQFAARHGDAVAVAALLAAGADTEYRDHNGDRALLWAAEEGEVEVVGLLLQAGSPPDADDPYGQTALMAAAFARSLATVDLLLAAGADPHRFDHGAMTALHHAAWAGSGEVAARLLATGVNPNTITDILFEAPLHYAVRFGDPALIEMLVGAGAALEARDSDGRTALLLATLSRHEANVAALLHHRSRAETPDRTGVTPLMIAARDGLVGIATLLLQYGADGQGIDQAGKRVAEYLDDVPPGPIVNENARAAVIRVGPSDEELATLKAAQDAIRILLAAK